MIPKGLRILLHALFPLYKDPYFGHLFILLRFLLSFTLWLSFFTIAGFLVAKLVEIYAWYVERPRSTDKSNKNEIQGLDQPIQRNIQITSKVQREKALKQPKIGYTRRIILVLRGTFRHIWNALLMFFVCLPLFLTGRGSMPLTNRYFPSETKTNDVAIPLQHFTEQKEISSGIEVKEMKNNYNQKDLTKLLNKEVQLSNVNDVKISIENIDDESGIGAEENSFPPSKNNSSETLAMTIQETVPDMDKDKDNESIFYDIFDEEPMHVDLN